MSSVQIVYASRHGGTAGIAQRIAAVLEACGAEVVLADAAWRPDSAGFDAYLVGSGVYMGSWLKEATDWLDRNAESMDGRPVWLFSSGPLPGSSKDVAGTDPVTNALGPADGPGSGGRKRVEALGARVHARDHRVFQGAFDPDASPKTMAERVVRILPAARSMLPAGDFREWELIEAWARELAAELDIGPAAVPVAAYA